MYNLHLEEKFPSHHDHLDLTIASHTLDPVRDLEGISQTEQKNYTHICTTFCSTALEPGEKNNITNPTYQLQKLVQFRLEIWSVS